MILILACWWGWSWNIVGSNDVDTKEPNDENDENDETNQNDENEISFELDWFDSRVLG